AATPGRGAARARLSATGGHRQPVGGRAWYRRAPSAHAERAARAVPQEGTDEADAPDAALPDGRLQLSASGPLRGSGLSPPAHVLPQSPQRGLRRRRLSARRAATARAVEGRV